MTEAFLSLAARNRKEILETAAGQLGRPPFILEKDIWICWLLQVLFSIPNGHPMAFKGGTSLSKVYQIIDRFSEDVDITLDYKAFDSTFDPFDPAASGTDIKKFNSRLKSSVRRYLEEVVEPALQTARAGLATPNQHVVSIDEDGERVWFVYPSAVEDPVDYVESRVLLEFGGRNVIVPNEQHKIAPYITDLTGDLDYPAADVTVLSPERTFWEKATLIHVECHRRRLGPAAGPKRLARHWFDLVCFAQHHAGRAALSRPDLLEDVVRHKKIFFNASYARYDRCLDGCLRLVPDSDQLASLKSDYDAMRVAGILSADAPTFGALIQQIRILETEINS